MKAESLYIQKLTYDENTGNEIIGLFPSEANPAIVSPYTYDAKRMGGAPTITATIYSSEPLQWKKEEFVEYNGDRYFASYTPNSTKDNTSRMWKSEITFTSRRELLDNTLFFDVVVDDVDTQNKDRYRSNQTKFTFGGTIHEFVARINSSMAYCGLYRPTEEYKGYYVVVDKGYGTDEVKEVSFEDQYLTDVLQLINTTFELDYYWDGNVCHVGKVQHDLTDTPIKYGSSDALISVSKENANYKIVDMITGYGSSDNLPYYYPNDDEFGEAVFNTENISKDKVSVDLSKFLKGSKYNDVLVLYKSKYGQKYSASIDSSLFGLTRNTEPENLTLADNQTNPTVTCSFGFSFYVKLIKGQILDFTKLSFKFGMLDSLTHKDNITEITAAYKDIYLSNGNDIITITKKTVFGDNCKYPCENDGEYKLTIWAEFSYRCRVFRNGNGVTDYYGANSWNASFSGNIGLLYEPTSEYEWKNEDKYIPYGESGINIREISGANCIEYDYQFFKDDNRYGFNKVYSGTDDNATKVVVTDRVWIAPSSVLMPSIYRNSKGAERFYYAFNNTHKLPSGIGYYEFVNLYKKGNPHQGTVTFDDIKPTINGIVNAEGQLFGEIADVAFDKEDSDVKDSDGNYIHSYFYIKLHKFNGDFGFDLFAHALASESAKINLIKSNGCPACSFTIDCYWNSTKNKCYNNVLTDGNGNLRSDSGKMNSKGDYILNDTYVEDNKSNQDSTKEELWIAVQKDTSTLGIVMPNASAGFKPQKGDLFVITGIKPPKVLVTAAEKRLDDALIKHMSENNTDQFNYSVKFSRIFLQENPDFASKLNENAKLSIQIQGDSDNDGNLISHEVFVSNYSVKVDNDELAEVEIELVNSLEVTKSDTKQIIDAVKGEAVKSLSSMVGGSNTNSFNASITDKMYLSKLNDDIAKGTITWEKIQKLLSGLVVGNFNNENGGSWTPDTEGRSHLITDYLEVRMKAIFEELVIKKTSTIGGKEIISPAGGVVSHKVEEITVTYNNVSQKAYRCYFLAEQEGDAVDNDFAIGDQVRSESFNVRKGTYHKVGNHFYWRLVIGRDEEPVELEGKKYHYIDLSDTDCATASDVPAKGDVLSQCGNRTDVERQNCLIFSAVDTYSPSISLYHGINSYSFANKEFVGYGVNKQTNKAFFNVYGDMYVGDRPTKENGYEGSSYVKYDSATKQVVIKGKLSAKSTVDGKELSQYIKENSAKGLTEEQVNNIINNSQVIADLQNQVDGAIETWFYDGVPTLTNAPASSWTTNKDKDTHLGDLYYDNKTGKAYRFAKDGNTYKWTIIMDTDIAKALADASKAQETADGKMKVFSSQPTPPYQVGDIWVNATYPSDGSTYKNEVLRCHTDKKAGYQFAIADWIKASKYTDDTVANAAKKAAEEAKKAAETAQTNITNLGKTVTTNKKAFDSYVTDGYLEPSEIAAMAQDSKRLEDDFAAAEKSYNEVKGAEVLKSTKELTDLNTAFATLTTAKTELVTYLSDISSRYNAADTNGKATIVSAVGTKFTNFQSAYSAFYDKLGLANAYITSKIYGDLKQNITDLAGYKYIKDALGQTTDIDGGLVMTTLLALRDADGNVQSGINGAIDTNRGKKSIATWWGGQMVDKDYNSGSLTPATSLVRFDGSGYLANGAIWWDVDGKVHADPTSFIISEKNLGAYLAFFEPTWKSGSNGTNIKDLVALTPQAPFTTLSVSNDLSVEGKLKIGSITLSVVNGALKIDGNVYSTGGMSAYGEGTSNGGGLTASVKSYTDIIKGTYTDNDLASIPNAYAIKALSNRIDNISSELGGLSLDWANITGKPSAFTPSAHTHKWVDITDRITKVSQLTNDSGYTTNKGTVTSVKLTLPTGLSLGTTKEITTSGTFAISLTSGYSIPTTSKQGQWDSAYNWYKLMTTDEETADGVINKWNEVVDFLAGIAQTDSLDSILSGINKSITDETNRAKKAEGANATNIATNKANITTLQGYFTSGSAKKALQLTNARKLWGNSFNGTADINGSIIVPSGKYISIGNIKMEYDATNKALKITNTTTNEVANLYTSGGVSAYGVGTSQSSGGGLNGSVKAYADSIKLTTENLSEIASAYSIAVLNNSLNAAIGRISTLEGGSATSIETTGSGNAVTSVSKSGTKITFTKGSTFSLNGHTHDFITVGANQTITATQYTNSRLSVRPYYSSGGPTTYGNILEVVSGISGGGQLGMEWSGSQTKTDGTDTNVGKLYYRSKRDNMAGWTVWKRLAFAEELAWGNISGKPTSLSGYGITDGVNAVSVTGSGNAVTAASVSGHTLTLTKGSSFSLSNHTHYIGTTQVQGSSAEQALTGITKIDNILKLSKASVTVNTSYKAEQNRLVIYGSTYGNDANYIKSAGKLSYGDGGPQLVFSTGENPDASGVQSAALVYTDHDTIGAGVSLSFVTNQGDAYFIAPHIKALTEFQGNLAWSYITNKPTTLSGFGITDGLRSVTQPSGSNVFVTGISTSGTTITYTKSYTKKSLSAVGASGWTNASIDGNIIPDMSFIAYWNGAYSGTSSNLAYCNKGAFGSFAIKNSLAFSELTSKPTTISGYGITDAYTKSQVDAIAAKYLPLTGGTLTGQLKIVASALNGAYNGLLIGDDCYIGDCNLGNTIGLMGVGNHNAGMVKFGKGGMQFGYNGSNHIASTTAQWTNLNADLLDGWHKDNIVWSGAVNSNTASLSHYWAKLFDITVTGNQYDDRSFTFLFSNGFNDTYSVVVLRIRQNGAKDSGAYNFNISLRELVGNMSSRLRVYYNNATGNVQLWGNCQVQYGSLSYTIIKKTGRTTADFTSQGTLVTNTSFSAAQSLPATTGDSPYTLLDGATRIGIVKQADQLVTARSLWGQSFNGTANVSGNMTGVGNINTSAAPAGTIYTNNWFRSKGSTGWYSEDHGGGWYMSDNTWIRNFGSKDVYLSNRLSVNGNVGIGTTAPSHKLHVLGEIYTTTKVNINGIILEKDSNGDLKVNGNLYATGGISAYGASDGTSSSGGLNGSVKSYADALKLTSESLSEIASAYSIKQLSTRISSLEGGSATSISVSGSGNAVTSVTKNGTTISVVKGSTFLTAHQSLAGYMKTATADAKYMYHSRNNIVSDLNSFATNGAAHIYEMNNVTNRPNSNSWVQVMNWGTGDSNYGFLLANDYSADGHMYFRQKIAGSWKDWKTIIDSSNIGSQSVNYAASAGSVAWTNVSGRPSTMKNPSALSWSGYSSGSYDGSAAKSISIPNNTNQLANGAGFITSSASITGNAGSATKLQTTRTLWGQSFNGTANISGSMTGVGDMTLDAGARIKHGSGNLYIGNSDNSNWIGVQDICSQSSIGDGNWSLRTSGAAHFKDTTINGTATIKNLLSLVDGSHKGLKMGSTYISSLDGEVILQGNTALRFGNDAWDYNQWAGLKYDHSSKTVYLGIADGSIFKANSAQSGGVINLKQGISSVYTPALYAGGDIYHTGVYRMLWKNSKASTYLNVMNISQDDNGILTIGYGNFSNNKNVVLEGYNLNFRVGNDSGMKSMWLNYNNGNPVLSLDGNFYATGGVTAYKSSDERLKHDIHGVDSLAIIKAMGGTVAFRYNADNKDSIGWIAQRVLHNTFMQDLVEKDDKGFLKINYWSPKLIAVAFGAIEQVDDEVSRLKRRVRDLENEVEQLKSDRL